MRSVGIVTPGNTHSIVEMNEMASLEGSENNQPPVAALELALDQEAPAAARKPMKYWQTMLFAATALVVMAIAATFASTKVNNAIAEVTERQVIDLAEENTTRDALHIQSMVIGGNSVIGRDASHTMHMYADGSMVMESDSDAGSDTGSVTSM